MKKIKLTNGKVAIVDDEDFDRINSHKWYAGEDSKVKGRFYAMRGKRDKKTKKIHIFRMQRDVLNITDRKLKVIFLNGNFLDCRKENLKIWNGIGITGEKGVTICKSGTPTVNIHAWDGKKSICLYSKTFPTIKQAAKAYKLKVKELKG